VHGLRIRITPTGKKTFSFVYWSPAAHKQRRITLNRWPADPTAQAAALDDARSRALTLAAAVAAGEDPGAPKDVVQGTNVSDLVRRYLAGVKATLSPMSHRLLQRVLEMHVLPTIGDRPFAEIRRADLRNVIDLVEGAGAARNVHRDLSRLFTTCIPSYFLRQR
jgi:hypothetical protein